MTKEEWKASYKVGNVYKSAYSKRFFRIKGSSCIVDDYLCNIDELHDDLKSIKASDSFNPYWHYEGKFAELISTTNTIITNYQIC